MSLVKTERSQGARMNTNEILILKVTIKSKVPSDIQSFKKLKKSRGQRRH